MDFTLDTVWCFKCNQYTLTNYDTAVGSEFSTTNMSVLCSGCNDILSWPSLGPSPEAKNPAEAVASAQAATLARYKTLLQSDVCKAVRAQQQGVPQVPVMPQQQSFSQLSVMPQQQSFSQLSVMSQQQQHQPQQLQQQQQQMTPPPDPMLDAILASIVIKNPPTTMMPPQELFLGVNNMPLAPDTLAASSTTTTPPQEPFLDLNNMALASGTFTVPPTLMTPPQEPFRGLDGMPLDPRTLAPAPPTTTPPQNPLPNQSFMFTAPPPCPLSLSTMNPPQYPYGQQPSILVAPMPSTAPVDPPQRQPRFRHAPGRHYRDNKATPAMIRRQREAGVPDHLIDWSRNPDDVKRRAPRGSGAGVTKKTSKNTKKSQK